LSVDRWSGLCEAFAEEFVDGVGVPGVDADLVEHGPGRVAQRLPKGMLVRSILVEPNAQRTAELREASTLD
jgi:hypothetical protein